MLSRYFGIIDIERMTLSGCGEEKATGLYHRTKPPLRTIIIVTSGAHRVALVADLGRDPRFKIIGQFGSLSDGYALTEAHPPDLTLCSKDISALSEFPMFEAMVSVIGSTLLTVRSGAGAAAIAQSLGLPKVGLADPQVTSTPPPGKPQRLVAIGASTGGIEALSQILATYPKNCPPTVIVQHIKHEFLAGVVDRLNHVCLATVVAGAAHMKLIAGQVVIAPGLPSHLEVTANSMRCSVISSPPMSGHRPSVDVLFHSVAALRGKAVGVLLTGMGRDGASGLAAMRQAGAWTIAQDAATSTIYGMPRVATENGAVCEVLPLQKISKAIISAATQPLDVAR